MLKFPCVWLSSLLLLSFSGSTHATRPPETTWVDAYRDPSARLIGEAMSNHFAWERLALLGDTFGHRLSGSRSLEDAIQWVAAEMKNDGLENVHTEPVKVPHWVRAGGAEIISARPASRTLDSGTASARR
jgi:carboxypeptidase Q